VVCAVAHERPHDHVALEHFLPSGPFAQLPMSPIPEAANLSALVWTDRHDRAARFMAMDDAAFAAEIQRRLGDHLGAVRPIGRRWSYPLGAMFAHRTIDTRLALVGDAAHGIHPIAGQGLNLGFRDLIALAALVIGADDPGAPELLRRYQIRRRPDNMMMLAATDALDRLFRVNLPPVRLARDLGLAAVQRLPRLKQFFMKTAMGI
jgi:2-octaprenyl-6-methoxyphenol hydroxylase